MDWPALEVIAEPVQIRRAGVPVGDAVDGRVLDVEIARRLRRTPQQGRYGLTPAEWLQFQFSTGVDKLKQFREAAKDPGQSARPGGEGE